MSSRTAKTFLNARVNLIFFIISAVLNFYARKVFIGTLGLEMVGLTSTISNVISFLNLAEFSMAAAVSILLFKPLHDNNKVLISEYLALIKWFYKKIGLIIFFAGIGLSFFLPAIFHDAKISSVDIFACFFTYLLISVGSYFLNFKRILFVADQKQYMLVRALNISNIFKIVLQIFFLKNYPHSFYIFLSLELLFTLIYYYGLNRQLDKEYSWLCLPQTNGPELVRKHPVIILKTKQLFSHQLASFILTQTDQLLIFAFSSLKMVANFSNYSMIVVKSTELVAQTLGSSSAASIGNLVHAGSRENTKKVFGELLVLRYWITGVTVFCLYELTPAIISIWLGQSFLLDKNVLILMLVNCYIIISRQTVSSFLAAYGIFHDVWAPWVEAFLNLFFSVTLGYFWGVPGILAGTLISLVIIVVIWKPILLYSKGFDDSITGYWRMTIGYMLQFLIVSVILHVTLNAFKSNSINNISDLIVSSLVYSTTSFTFYGLMLYASSNSMRNLIKRLSKFVFAREWRDKY